MSYLMTLDELSALLTITALENLVINERPDGIFEVTFSGPSSH